MKTPIMSDSKDKQKLDLGLLEEDDEFEEFPAENWTGKDEDDTDINVWEDNWDDETAEDDFSIQLSMATNSTPAYRTRSKVGLVPQVEEQLSIPDESTIRGSQLELGSSILSTGEYEASDHSTDQDSSSISPGQTLNNLSQEVAEMNNDLDDISTTAQITKYNLHTGQPMTPLGLRASTYLQAIENEPTPQSKSDKSSNIVSI